MSPRARSADLCVGCFADLQESETCYNATMDGYLCALCASSEEEQA